MRLAVPEKRGAFHSTKNFEISGPKLNGTVKVAGNVFENLGIATAYDVRAKIIPIGRLP